jgi:hypothetical protein
MSIAKERDIQSLSQVSINYIFFGLYFIFTCLIHVYHVFLIEAHMTFARYFFLSYAVVQCAIETLLLVLFGNAIKIFFRSKAMAIYSIVVFFLLMTHLIDFPLVRFMDMSFWYALNFISAESPQNFLELLYASNVSLAVWIVSGIIGFAILVSGMFFFRTTERWTHKRPFVIPYSMLAAMLCTLCLFLMSWDYSTHKWVGSSHYGQYQKTLPWKSTFFHRHQEFVSLLHPLKAPDLKQCCLPDIAEGHKPDIFLFVIESLREDYIQKNQAPHLFNFKQENTHFELALANANATQYSWFSLFYSQSPFYWGKIDPKTHDRGSFSLQLLKKMGYEIHCFSSARLSYYQMDTLIFGKDTYLVDEMCAFGECHADTPCIRDGKAIDKVIDSIHSKEAGGRLFIVFLDSTHHDYSWPQQEASRFMPYEEKINYFTAALSNSNLEMIKNRYRNALYYVDSLFGKFLDAFNTYSGKEEAVVVVLGDHGEEFYEEGRLFHASSLSSMQTHIPLYYKFGKNNPFKGKKLEKMTCHMDVFPTLLHYLTGQESSLFQGQSIFREGRWPFTVIGRFNASRSPCEFCIHNGNQKLTATFSDERDIFNAKGLRILSLKNANEEIVPYDHNSLKMNFGPAFDHLFAP